MTTSEKFARKLQTVQSLMDLGCHKKSAKLLELCLEMVPELPEEEQIAACNACEAMALKGMASEQAAEATWAAVSN